MDRSRGSVRLRALALLALLLVGLAMPAAPSIAAAAQGIAAERYGLAPSAEINPRRLAGAGALVVTGLLLLLFFFRRRLYILFWVAGWVLLAVSMFLAGHQYVRQTSGLLAYGMAQFVGVLSTVMFVAGADAYPARSRMPPSLAYLLVPVFLWFGLAPLAAGPEAAFAPGHVLMAGGMAASGVAYFALLRHTRLIGAAVVGASLLTLAGTHVWIIFRVPSPDAPGAMGALFFSFIPYLTAALGMQLITFEDMTLELRRTNRRLETAQRKLRRMAITDPVTGCRNRQFFAEVIGRELQRRRRYGIPLSVLFVDVDNFKAVNDRLGHERGDHVLRDVADFLLANIREADYVFRWGGDEFLILLSCGGEEARRRGEALREAFGRAPAIAALPVPVGLSLGTAEIDYGDEDVLGIIRAADERMYADKKSRMSGTPSLQ